MKKKILITLVIVLLIAIGIFIIGLTKKDSEEKEKILLFGKELNSLEDLEENDIQEYLKIAAINFREKTYTTFDYEQISIVVAYELLMEGSSATTDEVKKFVKSFFGKEGFELKVGKYISPLNEEIIISKNGDEFVSNLLGKGAPPPYNLYNSMEIKNNQVIVHYDYGNINLATGEMTIIGNTDIYLNYTDDNLILEKIVYTKKDSEQKEKIHLFDKELNSLSELSDDDIKDYTNVIAKVFVENNYNELNYSDIVTIVAYKLLVMNSATSEEIANYIETILGIKDFQLKEGIYKTPTGKSEIVISKNNDNFTSNLKITGPIMGSKINVYRTLEVIGNYVIVHYDYGYDDLDNETFVVVGKNDIYLKYIDDNLILEKIVYTKKD